MTIFQRGYPSFCDVSPWRLESPLHGVSAQLRGRGCLPSMTSAHRGGIPFHDGIPQRGHPLYDISPQRGYPLFMTTSHIGGIPLSSHQPTKEVSPFVTPSDRGRYHPPIPPTHQFARLPRLAGGWCMQDTCVQCKVRGFILNPRGKPNWTLTFSKPTSSYQRSHQIFGRTTNHPRAQSTQYQTEHRHQNLGNGRRNQAIQSRFQQAFRRFRHLPIVPLRI